MRQSPGWYSFGFGQRDAGNIEPTQNPLYAGLNVARLAMDGQAVGIEEVHDDIWMVSFRDYDSGYFDLENQALEPPGNPFGPQALPV